MEPDTTNPTQEEIGMEIVRQLITIGYRLEEISDRIYLLKSEQED